jgi:Tfp pilus assembly protein PilF
VVAVSLKNFHWFGLLLVPGVLYALLVDSPVGRAIARASPRTRFAGTFVLVAFVSVVFVVLYRNNLFFRLAILPVVPTWYTADGYTLFSPAHLVDVSNLAFVLLPGLFVYVVAAGKAPFRSVWGRSDFRFLIILVAGTWSGIFLLDPKLGMPRDWDLFAFGGVPLAVFWVYWAVAAPGPIGPRRLAAWLSIALGSVVLAGRVTVGTSPEVAVRHFESYLRLDQAKSRNSRLHLVNFYRDRGEEGRAREEVVKWERDYPERALILTAERMQTEGKIEESIALSRDVLELDPISARAYLNLGGCFLLRKEYARALEMLEVARALHADSYNVSTRIAWAYAGMADYTASERWWLRAKSLEDSYLVNLNLARLYERTGRREEYVRCLTRAAESPDAAEEVLKEASALK